MTVSAAIRASASETGPSSPGPTQPAAAPGAALRACKAERGQGREEVACRLSGRVRSAARRSECAAVAPLKREVSAPARAGLQGLLGAGRTPRDGAEEGPPQNAVPAAGRSGFLACGPPVARVSRQATRCASGSTPRRSPTRTGLPEQLDGPRLALGHAAAVRVHPAQVRAAGHLPSVARPPVEFDRPHIALPHTKALPVRHPQARARREQAAAPAVFPVSGHVAELPLRRPVQRGDLGILADEPRAERQFDRLAIRGGQGAPPARRRRSRSRGGPGTGAARRCRCGCCGSGRRRRCASRPSGGRRRAARCSSCLRRSRPGHRAAGR